MPFFGFVPRPSHYTYCILHTVLQAFGVILRLGPILSVLFITQHTFDLLYGDLPKVIYLLAGFNLLIYLSPTNCPNKYLPDIYMAKFILLRAQFVFQMLLNTCAYHVYYQLKCLCVNIIRFPFFHSTHISDSVCVRDVIYVCKTNIVETVVYSMPFM